MYVSLRKLFLSIVIFLLFASCAETDSPSPSDIERYLQTTNLNSENFPWTRGLADEKTKRWDIEHDGLIPVKFNGSSLAKEAASEIEAVLNMSLFDSTSIASLPDYMIDRGIIVSEGTAIGPNGFVTRNTCGHVSAHPETTAYPENFYDSEGRISTRLYVNLSSKKCTASTEIAIHEFGHALGLGKHFPGFGSGDVIAPSFWQVLYTLYINDVGSFSEDLNLEFLEQ